MKTEDHPDIAFITKDSIAFEGLTLEDAYSKASLEFNCSITDLKSEVIQTPSNGFFGLFKKNAIIKVFKPKINKNIPKQKNIKDINIKDISDTIKKIEPKNSISDIKDSKKSQEIFDDFYADKNKSIPKEITLVTNDIVDEIKVKVNELFETLCYKIDTIEVSYYDKDTIYIVFSGEDSALLIGKEGYRYKALSYILFNWIHNKYNLMVRLEVAQFLTQQEEAINKYLEPVIVTINEKGFYKTKTLDGILIHIALTRLRDEFPNKYVAVKTNIKGEKYILVNEYKK